MPHLTQIFDADFEVAQGYAAGDLDTQVGWAKIAGSGTLDLFVIASTAMFDAQCLAMRNGAAGSNAAYEKAIGVTRSTEVWRCTFGFRVNAAAVTNQSIWWGLSAGAGNITFGASGNTAVQVGVQDNGATVDIEVVDNSGATTLTAAGAQAAKIVFALEIQADHTFTLMMDANGDGEGWQGVYTGKLIAGKEAITRMHVGVEQGITGDDLLLADNFRIVQVATSPVYDKYNPLERPKRRAGVKAGTANIVNGQVEFVATIVDEMTGEELTDRPATMPISYLEPGKGALIDGILENILKDYESESRKDTFAASGHEVTF